MERLKDRVEGVSRGGRPLACALAGSVLVGCGAQDGTTAGVRTAVHVLHAFQVDRRVLASCVVNFTPLVLPKSRAVVTRSSRLGSSLTFYVGGYVYGCDQVGGRRGVRGRWCGGAAGLLRNGRLVDPRLDILCRDRRGHVVGFAWIQPQPGARLISVEGELYRPAGGLPVRVTTENVDPKGSSAVFHVAQYAAGGRELSDETLRVVVAG
jgi:hypothetical protein